MLEKAQEDYIQSTCFRLAKIKKKGKVFLTIQLLVDLYLLTGLFAELISSFYAFPLITLALIILKAIITIVKHDNISCIICTILNAVSFALAITFAIVDYNTTAAFIIAFIIYGLRIKQCILEKKIDSFYGYPTFNSFYVINEIKKDDYLCQEVIAEYNSIDNDTLLKSEIRKEKMSPLIYAAHLFGAAAFVVGILVLCNGLIISARVKNASKISSISTSENGDYFSGWTNEICGMSTAGMDKSAEDIYWCTFGEECVTIKVPQQYKEQFAMLYNHYAEENDIQQYSGYIGISGISQEKISFTGMIRNTNKYDFNTINTKALKTKTDARVITDKYIEVISQDTLGRKINIGIIITFLSAAVYVITLLFAWHQKD